MQVGVDGTHPLCLLLLTYLLNQVIRNSFNPISRHAGRGRCHAPSPPPPHLLNHVIKNSFNSVSHQVLKFMLNENYVEMYGCKVPLPHRIIDDRIEKSIKGKRILHNLLLYTDSAAPTDHPAFVSISRLLRHSSLRRGNPTLRKRRLRHRTFLSCHL